MTTALARPRALPATPCSVRLAYRDAPVVDPVDLQQALSFRCGDARLLTTEEGPTLGFAVGAGPTTAMAIARSSMPAADRLHRLLQETWSWSGARPALARCTTALAVTELEVPEGAPAPRLGLLRGAVAAVHDVAPCDAVLWLPSQQVVSPVALRESLPAGGSPDALLGAVNVRWVGALGGAPGEMVMDTLGLAPLGLPDLQCHCVGLAPAAVAGVLARLAYRLVIDGTPIVEGEDVEALGGRTWKARYEHAMVGPPRTVVDLDPGSECAGRRPAREGRPPAPAPTR